MVLRACTACVLVLGVAQSDKFGPHSYAGHTPESQQWEVVNLNAVSGSHLKDAGVWSPGLTKSFQECQNLCGKNTSCLSCDWAGTADIHGGSCGNKGRCYFRADDYWLPVKNGKCNHTSARKAMPPSPPAPTPKPNPPLGYQPNIVFILTDDQDTRLGRSDYSDIGSLEVMPQLQEHLMKGGARMRNAFVNTPICCPSRTEFFSGRYFHNVGPPNDPGSCMHADTSNCAKKTTGLFGIMKSAGYEVGVFGKVTNDQPAILELMTKEGSATWIDSPTNFGYGGKTYYHDFGNGTVQIEDFSKADVVPYGTTYQTAQLGNRTLDWLDALHSDPVRSKKPFFAYIGPHAPHFPAQPAPWYEHAFDDVTIPLTPNYNLSCADKAKHVRQNPPLNDLAKCWEDQHFRDRWASLLSVDDLIAGVVEKLAQQSLLEKTFIFYSSDHGYKFGQWRIGTSKQHPYETDIRVPLLARGPGIVPGSTFEQLASNVDVTPTIVDLAGVTPPKFMDGRSMLPWLVSQEALVESRHEGAGWRDMLLHEYKAVGTYYIDHGSIWNDGSTKDRCGGTLPKGPDSPTECLEDDGVGTGKCWFVDSSHSNSWRALRVLQKGTDLVYIEYDPDWAFNSTDEKGAGLQHYELYDISKDPYQMTNIYLQSSTGMRTKLHSALATYFACKGDASAQSTCIGADVASESLSFAEQLIV